MKNLEKDNRDLREKMQVMLSKTDNDDALIVALQAEMQQMARRAKEERRRETASETGTSAELHESRAALREKETQVDRQQKIIVSLRAELHAAVMRAEDSSRGAIQTDVHEARVQAIDQKLRLAEVQAARQRELGDLLRRKLEDAEAQLHGTAAALRQERQKNVELERLANAPPRNPSAGRVRGTSANGYPPEKVQQLVDRLNNTTEEMEALQESFRRTLEVKEAELRNAQELLHDQQQEFEASQAGLQRHIAELHRRVLGTHSR